ncbi:MAG: ATP-dependent helicase [Tyzzerella sp.]|nr:ATP-dependent helicase [Tyzzerella sp.]
MSLNQAQIEAIAHKDGPCMVLAGPGSGKTTVITNRIVHLIEKHKVKPEEILVITFSKAASKEMRERFYKIKMGNGTSVTASGASSVAFGTFHGIYYGILKWAYKLTSENIFSDEQKYQLLQRVVERMNLDVDDEKDFLQGIAGEISNVKNNCISLQEYKSLNCDEQEFSRIYQTYEEERKRRKKIDFDDMLVLTYELFQKRPDILKMWQTKYKYILIDEFQDINKVQYDVIRMLAAPEDNIFIVGDDDQSIYRFRGARPEIMLNFPKDFPETKQIILDVNYRSTRAIVNGAGRVIARNCKRYPKQIVTTNEQGVNVHVQEVRHPIEESKYVLKEIQKALKDGVPPTEIAVLFRTNNEARVLIETLMEYNQPFYMKEHIPNLYEHFIARNLIAYMKMALGDRSRKLFLEIMNRPNRYIGRDSVENGEVSFEDLKKFYADKEWMQDRIDQLDVDLRIIKRCKPYAAIRYIRKHIGYDDFLKEYAVKRRIKLEELMDVVHEIEMRAKEFKTIEDWFSHIEEYGENLRRQAELRGPSQNVVQLMTMHAAKGLEFHTVFIIGANEDVCPYKKAETAEEIEEERRLFYVAMTRAKKQLVISYSKERNGKKMKQSRFVGELLNLKK